MDQPYVSVKATYSEDDGRPFFESYISIFGDIIGSSRKSPYDGSIIPVSFWYLIISFLLGLYLSGVHENWWNDGKGIHEHDEQTEYQDVGHKENIVFKFFQTRLGTEERLNSFVTGLSLGSLFMLIIRLCIFLYFIMNANLPIIIARNEQVLIQRSYFHDSRQKIEIGGKIDRIVTSNNKTHIAILKIHQDSLRAGGFQPAKKQFTSNIYTIVFIDVKKGKILKEIVDFQDSYIHFLELEKWISEDQFIFCTADTFENKFFYLYNLNYDSLRKLGLEDYKDLIKD